MVSIKAPISLAMGTTLFNRSDPFPKRSAIYLILTVCVTISSTQEHSQDLSRKESQGSNLGCHQEVSGEEEREGEEWGEIEEEEGQ